MHTPFRIRSILTCALLLTSTLFFTGCPETPVTQNLCLTPTSAPLAGLNLSPVGYSFDNYYPSTISSIDGRIALHTKHMAPELSGMYAARVWTGTEWQTWNLTGTTSVGGLSYNNFRIVISGGVIEALAAATIDGVPGTYLYSENETHDGFLPPVRIENIDSFTLINVGELSSQGYAAAIGYGSIRSTTARMIILERGSMGTWSGSSVIPQSTASTAALSVQAVGYHTDGTPWLAYKETIGSTTQLKITRRVGSTWLAGSVIDSAARTDDSERVRAANIEIAGTETAVLQWTTVAVSSFFTKIIRYDLNDFTLGTLRTVFISSGASSCANCTQASTAYESDGIHGVLASRTTIANTALLGAVEEETFLPLQPFATEFAVIGTIQPYYNSCDNGFVTFYGRMARDAATPVDFVVLPLPARDTDARPAI